MSQNVPNLTNNLIQPQNIVINQVPLSHAIMTNVNANNGIPIGQALSHSTVEPTNDVKTGIVVETIPMAGASLVGVQTVPVQSTNIKLQQTNPTTTTTTHINNNNNNTTSLTNQDNAQVLTKQRLQDLIRDTDPTLTIEDDTEETLLSYVDEFVDRCLNGAALIAKNRCVKTIEVKDVQLFLNRNYNMWTPGFGTDELRPYKRSMITEAHKQRLALIRKSLKKY